MNKKLLIGIIAGICVVALVLGLVLGLSNCKGPEPTEPSQTLAPTDEPTDPPEKETEPEATAPVVEGGISYYSGMPDYSWYDPTTGQKEYILYTADQLYGLAELVNTMSMKFEGATFKLANNMVINEGDASKWNKEDFMVPWVPMGKAWGSAFSGTIDGQGHYISGLFSVQPKNNGFICYSQGATIKNLAIVNSYFCNTNEDDVQAEVMATFVGRGRGVTLQNLYSDAILLGGGYSTGGIVGYTQSAWDQVTKDCLVENCVFAGQIKNASGKGTGGILGHDNGSKYSVTVKNCLFIGTLDSKNTNCGGIVGFFSGESKLINCVSAGKVTSTNKDFNGVALIGSAGGNSTISNNYYVSTKSGKAIGTGSPAVEEGNKGLVRATMKGNDVAKVMTALDFAKTWTADAESYPVPTGVKALYDLVKKPLTEDTSDDSDKATSGGQSGGSSAPAGEVDTSWYNDSQKEFTISNVKQLYGLAQLVNEGKNFEGKTVKLSKDLVINSGSASKWTKDTTGLKAWTPIGNSNSKSFKGTFDGQGHYISGIFSVLKKDNGLFGYANGATVKNLAVINSFFENTGATSASDRASGQRLSAFVATGENVKLSGLYSNAILKNAGTDLGGIIGYAKGSTTVDSCAFAGTILSDGFERRNYGGIVGYNERGVLTVTNCLFSGKMDTKTHLQGGIVGRSNVNGTTIKNCVSVGEVKSSHGAANNSNNAIIGAVKAELENTTVNIENCYYLTGSKTVQFLENVGENTATVKETNVVKLEESAVKGEGVASSMTKLDFKSTWSALKDYYPVPTAVKAVFQATYKAHTHAWATAWASNSSHHWHECTGDGCDITDNAKKNGYGEHVYTDAQDETCNTCNYKRTIVQDDGTPSVYSGTPDTSWYKEENSEFVLTTADQLYGFAKLVNEGKDFAGKTVKLGKNMVINEGDAATFGTTAPSHKWTPIAVAGTARFRGTFDGQGKYISGIYSVQELNNGLFVYLEGGAVQNVAVINSYFENTGNSSNDNAEVLSSVVGRIYDAGIVRNVYSNAFVVSSGKDYHTGGIIGWARSAQDTVPTIDSCIFAGTIISNTEAGGNHVGGIIGGNDSNAKVVEISNCLMIGYIHSNDSNVGGIIGTMRGNNTKLTNCVVATAAKCTGTGSNRGPVVGNLNTDKGQLIVENCYYVAEAGTEFYGNVVDAAKLAKKGNAAITADQLKVQATFSGLDFTNTWVQTAEVPVPKALKDVYEANKAQHVCEFETEWTYDGEYHWHACTDINCDEIKDKAAHDYGTNGTAEKCAVCGHKNPASGNTGTPDTSWYDANSTEKVGYIMTEDQMLGLAKLVNSGTTFKGWTIYLGDNLVFNEGDASTWNKDTKGLIPWTPIGTQTYATQSFQGTFDGLGHTISGIWSVPETGKNNALFHSAQGATIRNLSVTNSYFENANNEVLATFVGRGRGVTLENLYSDAILVGGGYSTGGICGYIQVVDNVPNFITGCIFEGEIRNCTNIAGGILSHTNGDHKVIISDCVFNGSVSSTVSSGRVGGIVGYVNNAATKITGCVSMGDVISSVEGRSNSAIVGELGSNAKDKVEISYNTYRNGCNLVGGTNKPNETTSVGNKAVGPYVVNVQAPTITTQPTGSDYEPNGVAVPLKVVVTVADNGTLTYQWYKSTTSATDGFTAIDGATGAEYTPALSEDAWYRCEVTNSNLYVSGAKIAKVTSEAVKIHVHAWGTEWDKDAINHFHKCAGCDGIKDKAKHASADGDDVCDTCGATIILAAAPQIGGQPAGPLTGAEVGGQVELIVNNATASDGGTLTYQWYSNTTNSNVNGTAIEGATASTYQFTTTAAGNFYYYCVVTNTNSAEQINETVSNVAVVHVHNWKTEWAMDANNHWHECDVDGCPVAENAGKNGYGAHALVHNLCQCGYVGSVSYYDATSDFDPNTDGVQHEDTSWYDDSKNEFVLTNANQLFGLAKLVNGGTSKFEGKTITLACNMVINQGDASTWTKSSNLVKWAPIGTSWTNVFKGTFDGAEHYISGVFSVQTKNNAFFCYTQNAIVKNLAIINSYYESTGGDNWNAEVQSSIIGRGQGITLKNLYSDAIMVGGGAHTGGICAYTQDGSGLTNPTIDSCVFNGEIRNATGENVGGILGGDNWKQKVVITNCLNLGSVSSTRNCGGIVGYLGNNSTMGNCLNVGTVRSSDATYQGAALVGKVGGNAVTLNNCYYDKANNSKITGSGSVTATNVEGKTAAELKGTTLTGFTAWTVVTDDYPIPTGVKGMMDDLKNVQNAATPVISVQPQGGQYNVSNTAAALTVEATGDATGLLSYQWYKSTDGTNYVAITGATGNSYTPDVSAAGNTWYYCKVTNTNSIIGNSNSKDSVAALVHVHDWDETKYANNDEFHWNNVCKVANCTETDKTKMGSYEQHTTFGNHICSECGFVGAVSYYDAAKGADKSFYDASTYATTNEFHIKNANQLYGLAELVNGGVTFQGKTVYLNVNVVINQGDASDWKTTAPANNTWTPIGSSSNQFKGTLNGNGHYISGLYSKRAKENGLFGFANGATIQNLAVLNSLVWNDGNSNANAAYQGAFVARGTSVALKNLYSDAYLHSGGANDVGGILGHVTTSATVDSCVFAGSITNTAAYTANRVGGIVGTDQNGAVIISNCLFSGSINGKMMMGGRIIGRVYQTGTNITGCVGAGSITQSNNWPNNAAAIKAGPIAGIAGHTKVSFTMSNCYYPEGCQAIGWIEAGTPTVTDCSATAATGLNALTTMDKLDKTKWTATEGYPVSTGIKEIYAEKALFEAYLAAQN